MKRIDAAPCCPVRGLSLVESLITMLVLSAGLAAYVRIQAALWRGADLARQRAEALHLAREDLEQLRGFDRITRLAGHAAWEDIVARGDSVVDDRSTATAYRVGRSVATTTAPGLKTATAQVSWTDRSGQAQHLALTTAFAALDPRAAGWIALAPDARSHAAPLGRHAAIPVAARDLGDGRSAFKPRSDLTTTWVFDHLSGNIVQQCDSPTGLSNAILTQGDLTDCLLVNAYLLSGTVRFATHTAALTAADTIAPSGTALALDMTLSLTSSGHPSPAWHCLDDAPAGPGVQTAVHYWCLVRPAGTPPRWSGRLDVVPLGWSLGAAGAGLYRVCRYSADHDRNGRIDNAEHPAAYVQVDGALVQQNFLVVQADASCPVESAPAGIDHSTQPHQP